MNHIRILQLLNAVLVIMNGFVLFAPKKPVSGFHTNAAGGLVLFALTLIIILVVHLILFLIALYYEKTILLKVLTVLMVPLSLIFWYYFMPLIRF